MSDEERKPKITYFSKKPTTCPVCTEEFSREEMYTGGQRLIAGKLTPELRRLYEPSKKFGEVSPLVYPVAVCPVCYYAVLHSDFLSVESESQIALQDERGRRKETIGRIFEDLDFSRPRGFAEGAGSYFLALMCYDHLPQSVSPTFKQGMCALRGAWLMGDLDRQRPGENFDYLSRIFYRKARFFYAMTLEREHDGSEGIDGVQTFGPDTDKNYGFEGLVYIAGLLEFRYGPRKDLNKRAAALDASRISTSRLFGFGKSSREKPGPILEHAREMFDEIKAELETITGDV